MKQQKISSSTLICMDEYEKTHPLRIHLAYKMDKKPNIFGRIYHSAARLWLYKDLANIVLRASEICFERNRCKFVLYDGLRTVDAQERMMLSPIVQKNPQWLEQPDRLLSPPGAGAHPRGMAIDIGLEDETGDLVDMGIDFDYLSEKSDAEHNPAHRNYKHLKFVHAENRSMLDNAMIEAANSCGLELRLLESEWWDFRFSADIYNQYEPLADVHLPEHMQMVKSET